MRELNDIHKLLIALLVCIVIGRIVFINEGMFTILKTILALFWLLVLPGFTITYVWWDFEFIERLCIGVAISAALVGVSAYYLGLIGLHVKYSAVILPPAYILTGLIIIGFKSRMTRLRKLDA